jgi:hypothetical protein
MRLLVLTLVTTLLERSECPLVITYAPLMAGTISILVLCSAFLLAATVDSANGWWIDCALPFLTGVYWEI